MRLLPSLLLLPALAHAHGLGLSFLDLAVEGDAVTAELALPAGDLDKALFVDVNRDGRIDRTDLDTAAPALARWLAASVRLAAHGKICDPTSLPYTLDETGVVHLRARYACGVEVRRLEVSSLVTHTLGSDHRTAVRAHRGEISAEALLDATTRGATLDVAVSTASGAFSRFLTLGIEHILTGYDHVLFVLALLLLGGSLWRVIGVATAFTAAHTITLTLAAIGAVQVASRPVESLIALSIAFVAVENWFVSRGGPPPTQRRRWILTFVFGLVHGFGFAGAIRELGLPADHRVVALAAFNVGVELGQVAIIAAALPLIRRLAHRSWWRSRGVGTVALALFAVAIFWFVQRAFL